MKILVKDLDAVDCLNPYQKSLINESNDGAIRTRVAPSLPKTMEKLLTFDGVVEFLGKVNKETYGINPYEDHDCHKESSCACDEEYRKEKEHTEEMLFEAFRRTRNEIGGVSISQVAEIIASIFDEAELDSLEGNLYDILLRKYGHRKYQ